MMIQIHSLVSYPVSNLNRDDLGRPKTAIYGGINRIRVSSQSLKRAWRTSQVFTDSLEEYIGKRTKLVGVDIYKRLLDRDISKAKASKWTKAMLAPFGALKKVDKDNELKELELSQLVHFSPEEINALNTLADSLDTDPTVEQLGALLNSKHKAVDIAMFGRMLADAPAYNTEAAIQVAHSFTVNPGEVEIDYFTAVDDLNDNTKDSGSAHIGESEFSSGIFYNYVCIDKDLLVDNLQGDDTLAGLVIEALIETIAKIGPHGKQNSYASRSYASYIMVEKGTDQPRSLAGAFLTTTNSLEEAVESLETHKAKLDTAYGATNSYVTLNILKGEGSLKNVQSFTI